MKAYYFDTAEAIAECVSWFREYESLKVAFTNGCFDILTSAHVQFLEGIKEHVSYHTNIIVAINSDASVQRLKGPNRPINPLEERVEVLRAIWCVDAVVSFDEDTPWDLIKLIKPDYLFKGAEYMKDNIVGSDFVKSYGGKVEVVPMVEGISTTTYIDRIVRKSLENKT